MSAVDDIVNTSVSGDVKWHNYNLTITTTDRLQNYVGVTIRQNVGDLQNMKSSFLASLFHVASNKDKIYHNPHCPTDLDSWCKYNQ